MLRVSDLSIIKSNTDTTCIDSQASQLGMGKRIVRGRKEFGRHKVFQTPNTQSQLSSSLREHDPSTIH